MVESSRLLGDACGRVVEKLAPRMHDDFPTCLRHLRGIVAGRLTTEEAARRRGKTRTAVVKEHSRARMALLQIDAETYPDFGLCDLDVSLIRGMAEALYRRGGRR